MNNCDLGDSMCLERGQELELIEALRRGNPKIIGIDGEDGEGKTTLSEVFSKELGVSVFHLDSYLMGKGLYLENFNYEKLKEDLSGDDIGTVIIEGVLLLSILSKIDLQCDFFVYVCSWSWLDDWKSATDQKLEEILQNVEDRTSMLSEHIDGSSYVMEGFRREVYEYTYNYRPFDQADCVYRRMPGQ